MADYTFFFNPMSRAQIARWALHEAGADYEPVFVDWANKPQALLDANPMGKLPTIVHHHADDSGGHDHVVSEAAAVCHYLAEREAPELLPRDEEKADYFRWLFFAAAPLEHHAQLLHRPAERVPRVLLHHAPELLRGAAQGITPGTPVSLNGAP